MLSHLLLPILLYISTSSVDREKGIFVPTFKKKGSKAALLTALETVNIQLSWFVTAEKNTLQQCLYLHEQMAFKILQNAPYTGRESNFCSPQTQS